MEKGKTAPNSSESHSDSKREPLWAKSPYANLYRYVPSQVYFAKIRVNGKLVRKSLRTKTLSVAKLRLDDFDKGLRQRAASQIAVATGKMTFGNALEVYLKRLRGDISLKPRTKTYREERIAALLKSWPSLKDMDACKISKTDCLNWAADYQTKFSATNFNNTVGSLKLVLDVAVEAGARYDNPAKFIKKARIILKEPDLPSQDAFEKILGMIKHQSVADLVRFQAYSGMRISETRQVTWQDVDFEKEQIVVRGEKETGTKNWEIRRAPMIPEMKALLERIRDEQPNRQLSDPVMSKKEFRGSVKTACRKLGIPNFNHHAMRHLFITRCMELNLNVKMIADWVGHKDGGTLILKRYAHLRPDYSWKMAKKVTFSKTATPPSDNGENV